MLYYFLFFLIIYFLFWFIYFFLVFVDFGKLVIIKKDDEMLRLGFKFLGILKCLFVFFVWNVM